MCASSCGMARLCLMQLSIIRTTKHNAIITQDNITRPMCLSHVQSITENNGSKLDALIKDILCINAIGLSPSFSSSAEFHADLRVHSH